MNQPGILCEISPGLRSSERIAVFSDHKGRKHYIRAELDFLLRKDNNYYVPVSLIDENENCFLVELPHEAETGANRLWVEKSLVEENND